MKESGAGPDSGQTLTWVALLVFPRGWVLSPAVALSLSATENIEFLKLFFICITIHCSPDSLAVTTNKGSGCVITI